MPGRGGLGLAAFGAEFAFIYRAAGARPCVGDGLGASALGAEFAGVAGLAAGARPACGRGCRGGLRGLLLRLLLRTHLIEVLRVHAAGLTCHVHTHEGHRGACALIARCGLHRGGLRADQVGCGSCRVHKRGVALHLLEHLFVFLAGFHTGNAERHDLKTAQVAPLGRQDLIERVGKLHRVAGERGVADAHVGNFRERGLKGGQKLRFQLAVETVAGEFLRDVAADVRVEENRVADAVAVFAEAAKGNVDVDARTLVDDAEGNGRRRTVFVADELLGIEIVDALVLRGLTAEGEALTDILEGVDDARAELTGEDRGLGRGIIDEFTGLLTAMTFSGMASQ